MEKLENVHQGFSESEVVQFSSVVPIVLTRYLTGSSKDLSLLSGASSGCRGTVTELSSVPRHRERALCLPRPLSCRLGSLQLQWNHVET